MARKGSGSGGSRPGAPGWQSLRAGPAGRPPSDPLAETYRKGLEFQRRGQLREAVQLYRQVLAASPAHPAANHALGMAQHQLGNHAAAEQLLRRAIAAAPDEAAYRVGLGLVLLALDRPADAADTYREALKREPSSARAHSGLGAALLALGGAEEAVEAQRRALRLAPDFAAAHAQLGRALRALGRFEDAAASLERAIALQPTYLDAQLWLGDLRAAGDQPEPALAAYRAAAALKPDHAGAHLGLAAVLARLGRHAAAADNFRAAAYIEPTATAYAGLGRALVQLERPDEAAEAFRTALRLAPGDAALPAELERLRGGSATPEAGIPDRELSALERAEAQFRMAVAVTPGNAVALANLGSALGELGRLPEAIACYREALRLRPDYFFAWSELLFAINYLGELPIAEMVAEAIAYGEALARLTPPRATHANDRDPSRRLRVGLVSADLRNHPVGRFLETVVAALDSADVELFAYFGSPHGDTLTQSFRRVVPNWRDVVGLDDEQLERAILADRIDILLDLSGHTVGNRLLVFARKPAPVAVTWLGYFATTGLGAIDYVLASDRVIPAGEAAQWVERPWRLPETYLCFSPPKVAVPLAAPPALRQGYITFGSANNISKLNAATASCWAGVLAAVPQSRLLLRSRALADASLAETVRARFTGLGVEAERLILQGAVGDYAEHLARYNDVDIALDPFPYAGGTTTVESLWMGVPVLTLRGDRYVAHMGENILHNMGMPGWIAADVEDYVQKAAAFAADPASLAALRENLRPRLLASPLCDAQRFARHLEAAFRGMWRRWCEGEPGT